MNGNIVTDNITTATTMIPGTLVVLCNPSEAHIQNLFRLKQLCNNIFAVDNSPVPDLPLQERIRAERIDMLSNFNRGGVAGAYNQGLERLIGKGCQLLFIFDQDSEVPENYFQQMLDGCLTLRSAHFLIGPKVFDINVNRYLPAHRIHRFGVRSVAITDENRGLVRCASIITSGSAISAETYRILGPFREDFFIDHVDTEYSFRASSKGVPIYINTALVLKHQIGKRIDRKIRRLKVIQWNTNPLRQYYSARNCIHIVRLYGVRFPISILINVITIQQLLSIVLYEEDKIRKLVAMIAGVIDGLRDRRGTFETSRPQRIDIWGL